jgi:hypothetical protein
MLRAGMVIRGSDAISVQRAEGSLRTTGLSNPDSLLRWRHLGVAAANQRTELMKFQCSRGPFEAGIAVRMRK